ncbi:phosphoenolpyruvate--protein phosphotransferase [Clostridium botulinum]|uniref:Phosphoenolpyruvate-protein phosphotransferase n=1 Tax=Clostridium botulinum C/D str. DC5 TaxID=1443128 RepID=A0A0A0IF85_CLOBO|nr:phosphoenolpyruvate--protein phosphotransferase [Clostridium botulinum]KEI01836.1 phosphoenolpyruvate-protein phosphotransferase [Clostridium botulinum C/D str. BKT75002]KEI10746.1 phosphoenolpyruvate-protein phosphotransferase [Clostridium botulinum C/D str. BKT2873]KGM95332.1 phosphoenolpyruvate-protein phosphotransferase [Clostridium botulinum D str. CCUG 7971]KGM99647.1 phosphoenolpyruvate-protein phosphotransferase [Clostridium botulinum C/D str. DC5]KOC51613.1 phosphoenolpyruvate-prot
MIKGTGVCPGIAIAKALILKEEELTVEKKSITDIKSEKNKFNSALLKSREDLQKIHDNVLKDIGEDKAEIFQAHLMILDDPELIGPTISKIETGLNAEFAFEEVTTQMIQIFESIEDEYLKERAADVRDVSKRVLTYLLGKEVIDVSILPEEVILIAEDLTPSVTASMDKSKVKGFLTNIGGKTSHTAIMAKTLEIPAIVGLNDITDRVENGDIIAFNGKTGEIIINPNSEELNNYQEERINFENYKKEIKQLIGKKSTTKDGKTVELAGNIGTPDDINGLLVNDAEGVGLFRTEFLYMNRSEIPSEDEQYEAYKKVLEAMNNKPVVIRTLDIGGDKEVPYMHLPKESNPFLGYRAIRLCLDRQDLFITQLRALLRASIHGKLRIMFPMISSLEELLESKRILNETKETLIKEGIKVSDSIEVGMMIEVPSAAIISDILAKHVDFFSIGTNDLIQYTTAVDRINEKISYLYTPINPAVLRLIKIVIDNAHKAGIWAGMCGEVAGDERLIPILLGMGLDEFSMSAISILPARKLISSLSLKEAEDISNRVLSLDSAEEIATLLSNL